MDHSKILLMLEELRNSSTIMEEIFMEGSCLNLHYVIKAVNPQAEAYYNQVEGHVITKLGDNYYDIKGSVEDISGYAPLNMIYSGQYRTEEESKNGYMYKLSHKAEYVRKPKLPPICEIVQTDFSCAKKNAFTEKLRIEFSQYLPIQFSNI